ncbi:MAG: DUF2779 domain-containing protein [Chlamydiota bacterium]|nr:DUF2779 domain-containing protein [Chlamydiota bacterium]
MVEETARQRFSEGVLIEGRGKESLDQTTNLLKLGTKTLFQASFSDGKLFAAVDILKQEKEGEMQLYEVKASNASKTEGEEGDVEVNNDGDNVVNARDPKALEKYKNDLLKDHHLFDLAFQVFLARKVGNKVTGAFLVRLNKQYVRAGKLNLNKLFVIEDVMEYVEEVLPRVEEEVKTLIKFLASEKEPDGPCCCLYKGRSKHCTTFKFHNKDVPAYGVHDLTGVGRSKKKLCELIDSKIYEIHDIPEDFEFGKKIQRQIEVHRRGKAHIDHEAIQAELKTLQFPLYFLDYEAFNPAIPRFSGFKPYQQIPFQFSLDRLDSPDAKLVHEEFLYTGDKDPSSLLVEELKKKIGNSGSVIVWYKPFEESHVNKHLAVRMPEHLDFINNVNSRLFDLMTIFSKHLHVHPEFRGSASIKKVLPVLCPELSYKELEIGNGSEAMNTWNKMVTGEIKESERSMTEKAMREYCALDTYAMYAIWKVLLEM